jgi:hypothetical protein
MSNIEPRSGLTSFRETAVGDDGWAPAMVANMLKIGRVGFHCRVADRDLTAPPGSPADGDAYIVGASATDAWATHDNDIAVWDGDAAEWVFYTPEIGWTCVVIDEEVISMFKSGGWSVGAAV